MTDNAVGEKVDDGAGSWVPKQKKWGRSQEKSDTVAYVPAKKEYRTMDLVKNILIPFVIVVVIFIVVQTFLVQLFVIPSASMENTLQLNDRIAVWKLGDVGRGDIVVFRDPGDWLPPNLHQQPSGITRFLTTLKIVPDTQGGVLVKRAIGMPGDHIQCCTVDGKIIVNGVPQTEPYIKPGATSDQKSFDVTVPNDSIFVMGDNRANSADSRYHLEENSGSVPISNIVGKSFLTVGW